MEASATIPQDEQKPEKKGRYILKPRWKKGESGNPRGRQKGSIVVRSAIDVRALARSHSIKAIEKLAKLMNSPKESIALAACIAILDRGYGKPMQSVQMQVNRDLSRLTDKELETLIGLVERSMLPAGQVIEGQAIEPAAAAGEAENGD